MQHRKYHSLLTRFENGLEKIVSKELTPAKRLRLTIPFIKKIIKELNEEARKKLFENQSEEIDFFKNVKPPVNAALIYEVELYKLQMSRPAGTQKMLNDFYVKQLKKAQRVFREHAFQYQYFKSGNSELDAAFFSNLEEGTLILFQEMSDTDPEFSTGMDILFARFIALEKLQEFLLNKIGQFDHCAPEMQGAVKNSDHSLNWTGEAINLVEVAYGFWLTGQLNHGTATITDIVQWLEEHFEIKIGRAYRRWTEISQRKQVSTTKYLDQMVTQINKRVEDENDLKSQKRRSSRQN